MLFDLCVSSFSFNKFDLIIVDFLQEVSNLISHCDRSSRLFRLPIITRRPNVETWVWLIHALRMHCWEWAHRSEKATGRMGSGQFSLITEIPCRDISCGYRVRLSDKPKFTKVLLPCGMLKEPRRVDKAIPSILWRLNTKLETAREYEMIDANDFVEDMSRLQRHRYLMQVQQGMSVPMFHYTWTWGGSRAGINPHVIWRVPL